MLKAEKGEAVLKDLIETDEGSRRLGEVALPDDSPISNRRTIFDSPISNRRTIFITRYLMKMRLVI